MNARREMELTVMHLEEAYEHLGKLHQLLEQETKATEDEAQASQEPKPIMKTDLPQAPTQKAYQRPMPQAPFKTNTPGIKTPQPNKAIVQLQEDDLPWPEEGEAHSQEITEAEYKALEQKTCRGKIRRPFP